LIKKIILSIILILVIGAAGGYFHLSNEMEKAFPELMSASSSLMQDACKQEQACIEAISTFFPECSTKFSVEYSGFLSFQDDYMRHMINTYNCIKDESSLDLPSLLDHFMKEKYGEL
jgi:hypothetical protein